MVEQPPNPQENPKKTKHIFIWAIFCFILIGLVYLGYWWFKGRFYQWTDDAYVSGNMVVVTPQVEGIVTVITAQNTDFVNESRVLIELDKTDATIALEKATAQLAQSVRDVMKLIEEAKQYEAMIPGQRAQFIYAAQEYEHRKLLVEEGGVSLEDYEHATAMLKSSYASLIALEHQFIAAMSLIENTTIETHPLVELAKSAVRATFVAYQRCTIEAPVAGIIAQRTVQVGERVHPGQPLLAIIPLDQMWIDANYKEIQLSKVRIGQKATVKTDIYGNDVTFKGTVVGIAGGTGSVFSVLPPQNATGNWIKIVQRLPVRINLDPEQMQKYPLRLGLSVETNIDIHDTKMPMIPEIPPEKPIYETCIFSAQEEGAEALISKVIRENLSEAFIKDNP